MQVDEPMNNEKRNELKANKVLIVMNPRILECRRSYMYIRMYETQTITMLIHFRCINASIMHRMHRLSDREIYRNFSPARQC